MRIGLFSDTYPPYVNGVSTSVFMLKKALEKKGHQVYVVSVNNESMKYKFDEEDTVMRIPGIPIGIYDYRLTGIYPIRAINIIKKWKLDVIHSHTEFGVGTFARIISKQLGIPLIHTYHTMYEDYIHYITKGYFDKSSKKIVEYLTLFYCDKTTNELIVPTKKTYNLFKQKYEVDKNIHIIPTGIEMERFYKEVVDIKKVREIAKKYEILKHDFVLMFVGRLAKEKSVDFLIENHKEILDDCPNIKLLIVGDGPDMESFKEMVNKLKIEDRVIFTGKIPWEEMPIYYQLANIFVTASKTETQGLTVIEAMAASAVPVCVRDESFEEAVVDDLNGKFFENKKEYKRTITDLYEDKVKLARLSAQARLNAETHSSKYYAESVLDVYNRALKEKKEKVGFFKKIANKFKKDDE